MRKIPHQLSNSLRVFLPSIFLVIGVASLTWLGLNPFSAKERVPFEDLRWEQGRPEVLVGGEWSRLLSVNGVTSERLIDQAIADWGPAYQDRFVPGFNLLMERENGGWNILCKLTLSTPDGKKSNWLLSIPRRYWAYTSAVAKRQSVKREPLGFVQGANPPSKHLVNTKVSKTDSGWLSAADARQDIQYFEWTLERRYAYLAESKTTYQASLDDLVNDMREGISRRDLALRLQRILRLFDDVHIRVSFGSSRIRLAEKTMPAELVQVDGRLACLKPGRRGYLDPGYPFLKKINDVPLLTLQSQLAGLAPEKVSAFGYSPEALKYLKMSEFIMTLTSQPFDGDVSLTLESADGRNTRTLTLACISHEISSEFTLPVESRILKGSIGYLGLRKGMFPGEGFRNEIVNAMIGLQHTNGMILDLRGNAGGHRDVIPLVLRYFIPTDELPMVVSVAAVRMDSDVRPGVGTELLQNRMLWSKSWNGWTAQERQLIEEEMALFKPSFTLTEDAFSELFFMMVRSEPHSGAYYYRKKVIILHDNETASAAGLLLSALKGKKNVKTMGSLSNSDSGYPLAYQLPHSKIVYWLSSMASFKSDGSVLDEVEPDISYKLTIDDLNQMITYGNDPLLEKAAELIRNDW